MTPLIERLLRRSVIDGECWLWQGASVKGYGRTVVGSRTDGTRRKVLVHVAVWEEAHGPKPDGMTIDHECERTLCFRPEHLRLMTQRENTLRSLTSPTAVNARKERCPKCGGDYERTAAGRTCRPCRLDYFRRYNRLRSGRASEHN